MPTHTCPSPPPPAVVGKQGAQPHSYCVNTGHPLNFSHTLDTSRRERLSLLCAQRVLENVSRGRGNCPIQIPHHDPHGLPTSLTAFDRQGPATLTALLCAEHASPRQPQGLCTCYALCWIALPAEKPVLGLPSPLRFLAVPPPPRSLPDQAPKSRHVLPHPPSPSHSLPH